MQPSFESFKDLSGRHAIVPVWTELELPGLSPPDLLERVATPGRSFIMESVSPEPGASRFSYVSHEIESVIRTGPAESCGPLDPVALLRKKLAELDVAVVPGLPPFHAGAMGYVAYEAARYCEPVVEPLAPDPAGCPEAAFMIPRSLVAIDHETGRSFVIALARTGIEGESAAYEQATRLIERAIDQALEEPYKLRAQQTQAGRGSVRHRMTRAGYEKMVRDSRRQIIAGELIQVVISQRLERPTQADALCVYRHLRAMNPSPYMYALDFGDFQLLGASPELLARVRGREASIHPIAGTRRRGKTADEDAALEEELITSEKEQAEHVMLVDLVRNDLGRISRVGTVRVTDPLTVERYSHVMHLVSRVRGELAEGRDAVDAFMAGFPAGTLTGAPKIRSIQLIRDLEPEGRGPYCGGVGWFGANGDMDTGTVIRSILLKDGLAHVQGGGGIVFDSVPEAEYRESLYKMEAPLRAIDAAETGAVPGDLERHATMVTV